jgi:hypothetical protein
MAVPPRVVGACQSDEGAQRSAATTRVAPPPLGNHTSANVAWDGGRASGEVERRLRGDEAEFQSVQMRSSVCTWRTKT